MKRFCLSCVAIPLAMSFPAQAHIGIEPPQAAADSTQKIVLRVPHGCAGSPTVKLRVQIPEGVTGVKQQPKAGWKSAPVRGKLAAPYDEGHGQVATEGVREAVWSGGRLGDDEYDEFAMLVRLPNRPGTQLYFPVVQECVKGLTRWIEIPEPGKSSQGAKEPAPSLRLVPRP